MQDNEQKSPDVPQPKRTQPSFAVKDYITLGFSMVALTLSVASFYFTNFRFDRLQARVAEITSEFTSDQGTFVVVRLAFINSGNRPTIVLGVDYALSDHPSTAKEPFDVGPCETDQQTFPLLVQPHDIRLVDLKIPASFLIADFDSGAPVQPAMSSESGQEAQFFYALDFKSLDSEGAYHDVQSDFFGRVNVSKKRLVGGGSVSGKEYLETDLFHGKAGLRK